MNIRNDQKNVRRGGDDERGKLEVVREREGIGEKRTDWITSYQIIWKVRRSCPRPRRIS